MGCAHLLLRENIDGIHERRGYAHKRRLRGMAKYIERAMLDDDHTATYGVLR